MAPGEGGQPGQREEYVSLPPKKTKLQELQERTAREGLRSEFVGGSREKIEREYFGAESSDEVVIAATSRFNQNNKLYQEQKEFAIAALRSAGQKLFEAKLKQLEAQGKTVAEARRQLGFLAKDFWETVKTQQISIKGKIPDFSEKARSDVMNQREIAEFRAWAQALEKLSTDELETMISENAPITMMLQEVDTGRPVGGADKMFFDEKNPDYMANLGVLMNFIIGEKITEGGKEKSAFRQQGEALMWEAVVRGMKFEQKEKLVFLFCDKVSPAETKNFIKNSIIASLISRTELRQMQKDAPGRFDELLKWEDPAPGGQYHGKEQPKDYVTKRAPKQSFDEFVNDAVKTKDAFSQIVAEEIRTRETQGEKSGALYFLTFRKEGGEMLCRLGALTALLNGTLDIMDAINERITNKQSMPMAIISGLKEAAKNPYVWGGVAAAALGSEIVYPWMKDFLYAPSSKEKEAAFARSGHKYLKEQADNHSEVMDYMVEHFEDFQGKAKANELNKKRGTFDLYPGDFSLPGDFASKAGFENAQQARDAVIYTFTTLSNLKESKDIKTKAELKRYLRGKKLYGNEALQGEAKK